MTLKKVLSNKKAVAAVSAAIFLIIVLIVIYAANSKQDSTNIIRISQSELNQTIAQNRTFFEVNKQQVNNEIIEQDARNQIIDRLIVEDYAASNNIDVSDEELQNYYTSRIEQYGNEAELLEELNRLYSIDKSTYINQIKYDILRDKVQQHLGQPLSEWLNQQRDSFTLLVE